MLNESQFEKLEKQNEMIIRLLAAIAIQGKNLNEQVKLLSDVGLQPLEIATILGKKPNLIRVTKSSIKRKKNG